MQAHKYSVLLETMIAATVTVIAGFVGLVMPLFFLAALVMPLPVAYLIVKRDLSQGLLALALASLFLFLLVGRVDLLLLLLLHFGPPAVIIGLLIKNRSTAEQSIYILFLWAVVASAVNLAYIYASGAAENNATASEIDALVEQMSEYYASAGIIDEEGRRQLMGVSQQVGELAQLFLPASVIIWTTIIVTGTYFIARNLFSRFGYTVPGGVKFSSWRLPWYSVWLVIAGLAFTLAGDEFSLPLSSAIGKNILFVSALIFFTLGIAVMIHFLQNWRMHRLVKIIIALLVIMYLPFIILALGVIDPVANLRRLPGNGGEGTKGG